jgi:ABC-type arginine transport system ATPase subunit
MFSPTPARILRPELDVGALEPHDDRQRLHLLGGLDDAVAMTSHFMMPPKMFTSTPSRSCRRG